MLRRLISLFGGKPPAEPAIESYTRIVMQARQAGFYTACNVPDSLDGRFDMIVLHGFLVMRRLGQAGQAGQELSQQLFDLLFADMDSNLREIGVGDLSVGKKVKVMAQAFYGRSEAYEAGLQAVDDHLLTESLERNLYGTVKPAPTALLAMAGYVRQAAAMLATQPDQELLAGKPVFPPLPA